MQCSVIILRCTVNKLSLFLYWNTVYISSEPATFTADLLAWNFL